MDIDNCIRKRIEINGLHYYLIIGDDFVDATVAFENRPDNLKERIVVDKICKEITRTMRGKDEQRDI